MNIFVRMDFFKNKELHAYTQLMYILIYQAKNYIMLWHLVKKKNHLNKLNFYENIYK